jgi:hypothetical protein
MTPDFVTATGLSVEPEIEHAEFAGNFLVLESRVLRSIVR